MSMKKLDFPFDVSYTVSFSGRTVSDGVPTTTTQMIRDKLIYLLEDCISKGYIKEYTISAVVNNIKPTKRVADKAKK
jgi:hypothetical protein